MLHGALPVHWLPESSGSLLNPAWSISTEWQFYLVIPLFFWLVRRSPVAGWGVLMLAAAFSKRIMAPRGFGGASLFMNTFLFALGIVCYFVYAWVREHRESVRAAGPLLPFVLPVLPLALIPIVPNVGSLVWLFLFRACAIGHHRRLLAPDPVDGRLAQFRRLWRLGSASTRWT